MQNPQTNWVSQSQNSVQDPPKLVPDVPSDDSEDLNASTAACQRRATFNAALECCKELVTRCPENAQVAVKHGVVSIATTYIATHLNPPPNPAALRLLYQLVVCKEHSQAIYETMTSCLTIPALARLLDAALVHAGPQDRGMYLTHLQTLVPVQTRMQKQCLTHRCRNRNARSTTELEIHTLNTPCGRYLCTMVCAAFPSGFRI